VEHPLLSFLVGITGAIFANSTGAGGGVVFVPLFRALGFSDAEAIATSFGIQSFGMTTGALVWSLYFLRHAARLDWAAFTAAIAVATPFSAAGLWCVAVLELRAPATLSLCFAIFSVLLGTAILALTFSPRPRLQRELAPADHLGLAGVALFGGMITAWLSVGVGEFVAFYLIARRYDVTEAVAVAVVLSALTVWSAAPIHLGSSGSAVWPVVLSAGPGAVVGAVLARGLALRLGGRRLKRFFGFWLLLIGLAEFARA
jgi:uncharacterized membrane protein YfcA